MTKKLHVTSIALLFFCFLFLLSACGESQEPNLPPREHIATIPTGVSQVDNTTHCTKTAETTKKEPATEGEDHRPITITIITSQQFTCSADTTASYSHTDTKAEPTFSLTTNGVTQKCIIARGYTMEDEGISIQNYTCQDMQAILIHYDYSNVLLAIMPNHGDHTIKLPLTRNDNSGILVQILDKEISRVYMIPAKNS